MRKVLVALVMIMTLFMTSVSPASAGEGEPDRQKVVQEFNLDGTSASGHVTIGWSTLTRLHKVPGSALDQPLLDAAIAANPGLYPTGFQATIDVEGLIPGGLYTFWMVGIHALPPTIPTDVFVGRGASAIVGPDGKATVHMSASTGQAGILGFPALEGALWHDLTDPEGSLVRIEIAYHGQAADAGNNIAAWESDFWTGSACPPDIPNPNPEQPHCPVYYAATHAP